MITTGSKWFFGLGLVSLVLAAAYGWTTGGTGLGPVSVGFNGGVGEHGGYGILVATGVVAIVLGLVAVATRDADADALAQLAGTDEPPAATPPASRTYWPALAGLGVGLVALGLVVGAGMVVAGAIILGAVLVEWMVLAWSDRATGDPATNQALRDRLMRPLEYPVAGTLAVAVVILGFSRVFLTTSKIGAVAVAAVVSSLVLAVGAFLAARPRISPNVVVGIVLLGAIGTIALGVASAARGERTIEEHHHDEEPVNVVGLPPAVGIRGGGS
jgi:hypothetical protein